MVSLFANQSTVAGAGTSITAALASHQTGDRLIVAVLGKYAGATQPFGKPADWTLLDNGTNATGQANGNDSGTTFWAIYGKDATSSAETNPQFTAGATAPNSWVAWAFTFRNGSGQQWRDLLTDGVNCISVGVDATTGSTLTSSLLAPVNVATAGDYCLHLGICPTDAGTQLGGISQNIPGISGETDTWATSNYVENALGQDCAAVWFGTHSFTGTQSSSPAASITFTVTGAANAYGGVIQVNIREEASGPPTEEAQADFTGSGALSATLLEREIVAAAFAGSGSLSAVSLEREIVPEAGFTGSGSLSATAVQGAVRAADFTGSGTLSASAVSVVARDAAFAGSGSLSATLLEREQSAAAFAGSGTLSAGVEVHEYRAADFTGSGLLSAAVVEREQAVAALSGSGTLSATTAVALALQLSGAGSLSAVVISREIRAAAFSGSGTLSAVADESGGSSARDAAFAGSGSLSVELLEKHQSEALFSGSGTLSGQPAVALAGGMSGAGSLSAVVSAREERTAAFMGSGSLTADAQAQGGAVSRTAAFGGSGSLTAVVIEVEGGIAAGFTGSGSLSVLQAVNLPASFSGAGALSAGVSAREARSAAFSGVGSLTAGVLELATRTIDFSGAGSLQAFAFVRGARTSPRALGTQAPRGSTRTAPRDSTTPPR